MFSIVIPSSNIENLIACVAAIRAAGEPARVIVVWDSDPARNYQGVVPSMNAAAGCWDGVIGEKPFCFARNCNIGIHAAGGDDVVLLNDDAILRTPRGFTGMAATCALHPNIGLLSARVQGLASPVHLASKTLSDTWTDCTGSRAVPFVCVYIPRVAIDSVGLLDERFGGVATVTGPREVEVYGGEDDDYCYRLRRAGFRLGVYNGCVVDHGTLRSTFRPDGKGRSVAGARQRFYEIHGFEMGSK